MGDGPADATEADAEWDAALMCAVCRSLLFKPVVTPCGHALCFWCMHLSMNPLAASTCALCRAEYRHFPAIFHQLDGFVAASFPAAYEERRKEVRAAARPARPRRRVVQPPLG